MRTQQGHKMIEIMNKNPLTVDQADHAWQTAALEHVISLADQDYLVRDYLTRQITAVLAYAHSRGHEIHNWDQSRFGRIEDYPK